MDIEKTFSVQASQVQVWDFITSPEQVAACLPGVEEVLVQGPGKFKGVLKIKIGPIKTVIKADVEETEQRGQEFASYSVKGEEGGRASHMNANVNLALSALSASETQVMFNSHVVIVGRLGKFAGGVMNKVADSMSESFITEFRLRLEPSPQLPPVAEEAPAEMGLWARLLAFLRRLFGQA